MKKFVIATLCMAFAPSLALADNGADSRAAKFIEESYAMMRDGRLERAMEEQRANKAAFEALVERQQQPASGYARLPRR